MTEQQPDANADPVPMMATREATVAEIDRAARVARQIDRSTRNLRFEAVRWVSERDGATRDEKMDAARRLLLPIAAQLPAADDADPTTAIHAALLDPAYQLK